MIRKLSLAVAVLTALSPMGVLALGLGEIHPQSALNQTFKADIDLLSVSQEELQDVRVSLASQEAFEKAGMPRPFHLTGLKFSPRMTASGKAIIAITSKDPIREPFLNFLVEVNWPKGRLVREFTVLLDPPVTLKRTPAPVATPTAGRDPVTVVMPPRDNQQETYEDELPVQVGRQEAMSEGAHREYGPVQPNDNLWNIAKQMRQQGESIEQVMMALQDHNSSAFIDNNVNSLKVGVVLRLPEGADVTARSKQQAREEFIAQTRVWRTGKAAVAKTPPAAVDETVSTKALTPKQPEDQLKLVASKSEEGDELAGQDGESEIQEIKRLKKKILLIREENEGTLQENETLKNRVHELEDQVKDVQRLLTLKIDQLAEVQAAQSKAEEQLQKMQTAKVEEEETPSSPEDAQEEGGIKPPETDASMTQEPVDAQEDTDVTPTPEGDVGEEDVATQEAEQTVEPSTTAQEDEETAQAPSQTDETAAAVESPTPQVEESPVSQPPVKKVRYFDGLKENATLLAIIGGVSVLLIGLLAMVMRRRKEAEAEFAESILVSQDSAMARAGSDEGSSLVSPTEETSFMSDFSPSDIDALQDETGEVDPLSEADVYIAYGRYQQAEELVKQAIDKSPDRDELKLKLLEIYFSAKKSDEFTQLAQEMHNNGLEEKLPEAWRKVAAMGKELNPAYALFASAAGIAAAENLGNLDDLGLDFDVSSEVQESNVLPESETPHDLGVPSEFEIHSEEVPSEQVPFEQQTPSEQVPSEPEPKAGTETTEVSQELDSMDLNGLEDLDGMDSESLETNLSLDSEFLNKMDGVDEESVVSEDSDALDINLSDLEVDSAPSTSHVQLAGEEPLPFELSDIEEGLENAQSAAVDSIELEDSESLDNLDLESIEKELESLSADLDSESEIVDELSLLHSHSENLDLDSIDEVTTKLDLARAYIDMGDHEGAKSILKEVVGEGDESQQKEAKDLLSTLGS
jgi:pilus assembly protein FimV